jgi:3-dehydroquinate synthase II
MPSKSSSEMDESADRLLWIRSDSIKSQEKRDSIISAAIDSKADLIIVSPGDLKRVGELGGSRLGIVSKEMPPPEGVSILNPDPTPDGPGPRDVAMVTISGGHDQERAIELAGSYGTILVDCRDWQVIPLENLVAACQRTGCQLMATVSSASEAETALGALEKGVDGVVLETDDPEELKSTATLLHPNRGIVELIEAEVVEVRPAGSGDRACIDTCSLLDPGEGLLIGSQANGLVLVHAETITTEYVEARPFRVNAGAVHSYVLDPGDKTRYLSDLRSGDTSLVVGPDGSTRLVTIGRVKIETRPLILVEARFGDHSFRMILQDAETIRLVRPGGEAVSVKEIEPGDRILAHVSEKARHFGMAVEEKLIER